MQLFLRTAFALVVLTTFANGAYAGPASESQAIQGDEGKSNRPAKPGGGTSDAANPAAEDKAIKGDEGKY